MAHICILGSGLAGHRMAVHLAQRPDHTDTITLLGEEGIGGCDRRFLATWLHQPDVHMGYPEAWYEHHGIHAHLQESVVHIDRQAQTIAGARGTIHRYDRLILATGATPSLPDIPGRDYPGVVTVRTVDDVRVLRLAVRNQRRVAIIGGGPMGISCAYALAQHGAQVSLVDVASSWCLRHVDRSIANGIDEHLATQRIQRYAGRQAIRIQRCGKGLRVDLSGDIPLDVDVVVMACGAKPRDELALCCGLRRSFDGGIRVDERMMTDDPRICALGECSRLNGTILGSERAITASVDVIAGVMAGQEIEYPIPGSDMMADLDGFICWSMGEVHGCEIDQALRWQSDTDRRTIIIRGIRLVGACGCGDARGVPALAALVSRQARLWPWQIERFRRYGQVWTADDIPIVDGHGRQQITGRSVYA